MDIKTDVEPYLLDAQTNEARLESQKSWPEVARNTAITYPGYFLYRVVKEAPYRFTAEGSEGIITAYGDCKALVCFRCTHVVTHKKHRVGAQVYDALGTLVDVPPPPFLVNDVDPKWLEVVADLRVLQ